MTTENKWSTPAPTRTSIPTRKKSPAFTRTDWVIIVSLLLLSFVPSIAGVIRVVGLAAGAEVTPDNARFVAVPLPVVLHILGATPFCILGAFQFAPGVRRRWPVWHRRVGRLLMVCGLTAGLSGLWMTQFYPLAPHLQGDLLYGFRILFGSIMVLSIAISFAAILRRNVAQHRAWIIRGYAIGQGAGTQAFLGIPLMLIFGELSELNNALMMGAGWIINLAIAEWIIRRYVHHRSASEKRSAMGA
jgi:uncharacterized membrane protein